MIIEAVNGIFCHDSGGKPLEFQKVMGAATGDGGWGGGGSGDSLCGGSGSGNRDSNVTATMATMVTTAMCDGDSGR